LASVAPADKSAQEGEAAKDAEEAFKDDKLQYLLELQLELLQNSNDSSSFLGYQNEDLNHKQVFDKQADEVDGYFMSSEEIAKTANKLRKSSLLPEKIARKCWQHTHLSHWV